MVESNNEEQQIVEKVVELCHAFYNLGWFTGIGSGISIKHGGNYYVAPEGRKDTVSANDVEIIPEATAEPSIFTTLHTLFKHSGTIIHSKSKHAVMAARLAAGNEFVIANQEMIKGIVENPNDPSEGFKSNADRLVVPIINYNDDTDALQTSILETLQTYPKSSAILVQGDGVYVWGSNWVQAKTMSECYEYLFSLYIQMHQFGLDPAN